MATLQAGTHTAFAGAYFHTLCHAHLLGLIPVRGRIYTSSHWFPTPSCISPFQEWQTTFKSFPCQDFVIQLEGLSSQAWVFPLLALTSLAQVGGSSPLVEGCSPQVVGCSPQVRGSSPQALFPPPNFGCHPRGEFPPKSHRRRAKNLGKTNDCISSLGSSAWGPFLLGPIRVGAFPPRAHPRGFFPPWSHPRGRFSSLGSFA